MVGMAGVGFVEVSTPGHGLNAFEEYQRQIYEQRRVPNAGETVIVSAEAVDLCKEQDGVYGRLDDKYRFA